MQRGSIQIRWVPIKEMIADGFTKALLLPKHEAFVGMTGLEDQKGCLAFIKKKDDLGDALRWRGADKFSEIYGFGFDAS